MIKLIMNSAYGKTIQKKSETQTYFKSPKAFDNWYDDNFNIIKQYEENDFNRKITVYNNDTTYNLNFVGSIILSMSKRIMNETFYLMDEHKMNVYYTDTDSIHMDKKDLESKKLPDLKEIAKSVGATNFETLKKAELIDQIKIHMITWSTANHFFLISPLSKDYPY